MKQGIKYMKGLLQGKQLTKKHKRVGVSFSAEPHIIEAARPLPDDLNFSDLWYSKKESERIRAANQELMTIVQIQRLSDCHELFPSSKDDEIRGLEVWDPDFRKQTKDCRLQSLATVLTEQKIQHSEGVVDEEAIAQAYRKVSRGAADAARRLGLRDEQELICHMRHHESKKADVVHRSNTSYEDYRVTRKNALNRWEVSSRRPLVPETE